VTTFISHLNKQTVRRHMNVEDTGRPTEYKSRNTASNKSAKLFQPHLLQTRENSQGHDKCVFTI